MEHSIGVRGGVGERMWGGGGAAVTLLRPEIYYFWTKGMPFSGTHASCFG